MCFLALHLQGDERASSLLVLATKADSEAVAIRLVTLLLQYQWDKSVSLWPIHGALDDSTNLSSAPYLQLKSFTVMQVIGQAIQHATNVGRHSLAHALQTHKDEIKHRFGMQTISCHVTAVQLPREADFKRVRQTMRTSSQIIRDLVLPVRYFIVAGWHVLVLVKEGGGRRGYA